MRIAIIGPRAIGYPAGIDHYVTETAARLARRGLDVTVFSRRGCIDRRDEYEGVRVVRVFTVKNTYLDTPLYAFLATIGALRGGYDVIHYHGLGSAPFLPIARLFRKKIVVTVHALDWEGKKWGPVARAVLKIAAWCAVRFADRVTVVSRLVRRYFEERYHRSIDLIPNGAAESIRRAPDVIKKFGLGAGNYILFMGRLAPGKGCEYLIAAYDDLNLAQKLVVAGDAIHERAYVDKLKTLSRKGILFTGRVEGALKEELLSNAYLFVQPSELEGMSGVLLEAMSYGLCPLVSSIPQNLEVVDDVGFTFENRNVASLRSMLVDLSAKEKEVRAMGERARERVLAHFHWDAIAKQWEGLYREVIGQR